MAHGTEGDTGMKTWLSRIGLVSLASTITLIFVATAPAQASTSSVCTVMYRSAAKAFERAEAMAELGDSDGYFRAMADGVRILGNAAAAGC
jgi:hypothetical protein